MDALDISRIIAQEIDGKWNISNAHGVDLKLCLIDPPSKERFIDSFNKNAEIELWLVLEEIPSEKSGYKIVYDADVAAFGLAMAGTDGRDHFIGLSGTFLDTLEGM
jgi:hypothetical protein